ncbi:MAG: hypothetical protein J5827_00580 [Oscillospiraceae bacterium]|nr:hypothetical protein [Oscillospiraceae bacterium]
MKRIIIAAAALCIAAAAVSVPAACAKKNAGTERDGAAIIGADGTDRRSGSFTYEDAFDLFSDVGSLSSHAEYCRYVDGEAEKLKKEAETLDREITGLLKEKHKAMAEEYGIDLPYGDFREKILQPYEDYYAARTEAAELAEDAYLGISTMLTYGGNAGGSDALLWKYVHYRNLYDELCDLKDFITGEKYVYQDRQT